ncbi:MAG TPA: HopJ type III effector protein, partial [Agitococcus sp.]|nr:HopJ type III effector protein [Agitococcus sp.]
MLQEFFTKLRNKDVDFEDTIHVINTLYDYQPTRFANGITTVVMNEAGQNEGSCRIFAFALLNNLNEQETLACFGRFYQEVLNDPQGSGHGNIRNFMRDGWAGISFEGKAL